MLGKLSSMAVCCWSIPAQHHRLLPLTVARNMGIAVAYLPGTAMRRTAQLLPGDAKTDRRDAHVIAWAALKLPRDAQGRGPG